MINDRYPDMFIPGAPTIEPLSKDNLSVATRFAICLADDRNFHHFRHTLPEHMLNDRWEVYLMLWRDMAIAWGQIEKYPSNPHKQHVARLGFAVLPEFRRMSLGGRMVDYVLAKCDDYGKLVATTNADNRVMLSMFLSRGFIIEGFFSDEERYDNKPRHVISLAKFI